MSKQKATAEQVKSMFASIERGSLKKVRALLKAGVGTEVTNRDFFHETPLLAAARHGQEEIFLELVQAGADLHALTELHTTVLEASSNAKGTPPMVEAIIADGIRPSDGLADAFLFACNDGPVETVRLLLAAGAKVDAKSSNGDKPLMTAVKSNRPEIVAVLLKAGASTDVRMPREEWGDNKHYKKTALEVAVAEKFTKVAQLLEAAGAKLPPKPKRPDQPTAVADSWKRIAAWLKENASGWKPLRRGVTAAQVAAGEKKQGFALPTELRESFQAHSGDDSSQIFPCPDDISFYLMSFAALVGEWKMMKELFDRGEFKGSDQRVINDKGVQKVWWNLRWIPFAGNGGGDSYCVDLDPAKGGTKGQVIHFRHDSERRTLLAPSLRAFLFALANGMEDGKYNYDEEEGVV